MANMNILRPSFCCQRQSNLEVPLHIDMDSMPASKLAFSAEQECILYFGVVDVGCFVCLRLF